MFDGKFFSAQQYFTITRHNKYMYTFDSKHYYNEYLKMPKSKGKDSSKNESKAKQAQDTYPENRYVGSKLQFGEEMKKMFGLLFQRQVATLFKGFKDKSFYLCEKFMYLQDNHVKKCQGLIDFMKNKIKEVQKEMNIEKGDDLENSDKEEQIKDLYKEIFQDNDKLNISFVELLAPTPTNLAGDFDVMIEGVHKYEVLHNKIIKNFQNKSKQESNEIWTLQNYLQLDRKDNQWTRSIFEMKRNLLTEKEKSQAVYVVQEGQEDQFLKYLEDSSVFRTLTQLMKLAIAGKFYNLNAFGDRMKSMGIEDFQNLKPMTYKKEGLPIIDLYLVINSNIKQQQFKSCFDIFKPILRYWFDSVGAILHVIGFTKRSKHQIDIQKELQRQGKEIEIMNDRIKQLQQCMKKLMEKNENEKIKTQEDKEDRKEDKK